MYVRPMTSEDLHQAADVHQQVFVRQRLSYDWLGCNLQAYPRYMMFVIEDADRIVGFIIWTQKSGFRPEVVLELEQIAVLVEQQGQGLGQQLIEQSLPMVRSLLAERDAVLKHIIVTTRADNQAQQLYRKVLGAEVEAVIPNLYSADEVLMVARDV